MFKDFKKQLQAHIAEMISGNATLFLTGVSTDQMYDMYLASFPVDERQSFTCRSCEKFIRDFGNVVTILNGKIVTPWDSVPVGVEDYYQGVVNNLRKVVLSQPIVDIAVFEADNPKGKSLKLGVDKNWQKEKDKQPIEPIQWEHLYFQLPKAYAKKGAASPEAVQGVARSNKEVFKRSLDELTIAASETYLELNAQGSLYRGDEFKGLVEEFLKLQTLYATLESDEAKDLFCWSKVVTLSKALLKIRNKAAGTFLVNVSEGLDLDKAVKAWETVMAPTNYKRPNAIFTKKMVEEAEKTLEELGLQDSLARRFATMNDITVKNMLFVNRDKPVSSLLGDLKEEAVANINPKTFSKIETISESKFLEEIVPTAKTIELLLENRHEQNLASFFTGVNPEAPSIFPWGNPFSLGYKGNPADSFSMKGDVVKLGGRVDGVLRFTHSWNHNGDNQSLMDLHVFFPGNTNVSAKLINGKEIHDRYGKGRRVGWNNRNDYISKAVQDVDFVNPPVNEVPIENIFFPSLTGMPEGTYTLRIHNWNNRPVTRSGFKAEIEFGDELYQYEYAQPLANKEWITVAEITLANGKFTIKHHLDNKDSSRKIWGLDTNKFHKVKAIMYSPNFWDNGNKNGNKHTVFILDKADNTDSGRGFFNEQLKPELANAHKRVFEALGAKAKVEYSPNQLSGLGFSSTKSNEFVVKVTGRITRTLRVVVNQ